jgi:hypothetical protein
MQALKYVSHHRLASLEFESSLPLIVELKPGRVAVKRTAPADKPQVFPTNGRGRGTMLAIPNSGTFIEIYEPILTQFVDVVDPLRSDRYDAGAAGSYPDPFHLLCLTSQFSRPCRRAKPRSIGSTATDG